MLMFYQIDSMSVMDGGLQVFKPQNILGVKGYVHKHHSSTQGKGNSHKSTETL